MLGLQFNRTQLRAAINTFFTGDPKEHPDLAAVHKEMGLSGTDKILDDAHPLVVAARAEDPANPFVLAPSKGSGPSSVQKGTAQVFAQFRNMLGEAFPVFALVVCESLCLLRSLHLKLYFWRACRPLFSSYSDPVS